MTELDRERTDRYYMALALRLARKGMFTFPNPRVGAVIVKQGKIIGQGFHARFGGPHAEVVAIENSTESVRGAEMYVTLEPCNHYGKTPPCSERIIKEGIKRVVIAMRDPNPVAQGGVERLKQAGIEVKVGVLEKNAQELNRDFIKIVQQKLPYIYMKVATTLDGRIALANGKSKWITNEKARRLVHRLRAQVDAVLVGINTVLLDDPQLNVRYGVKASNLKRVVVLDSALRLPIESKLLQEPQRLIVFYKTPLDLQKEEKLRELGVALIKDSSSSKYISLDFVLKKLYELGMYRVLVEGGANVFSSFLREHYVDELWWFYGNRIFGNGLSAVQLKEFEEITQTPELKSIKVRKIGDNFLVRGYLNVYGNY